MFDSYVLLIMGVNVKDWSRWKNFHSVFSFRSSFVPLGFALANKENEEAYTHLGATILATAQTLGHNLCPDHILQRHGDMHPGIEEARKTCGLGACHWSDLTGAF